MPIEEAPKHGDRETLAVMGDEAVLDLQQRDVRRVADQAEEIRAVHFDPPGAAVSTHGLGRNLACSQELLDPAHSAGDADLEASGRFIARQAA